MRISLGKFVDSNSASRLPIGSSSDRVRASASRCIEELLIYRHNLLSVHLHWRSRVCDLISRQVQGRLLAVMSISLMYCTGFRVPKDFIQRRLFISEWRAIPKTFHWIYAPLNRAEALSTTAELRAGNLPVAWLRSGWSGCAA